MKKLIITTAIILGLGLTTFAQNDNKGGLFLRGTEPSEQSTRETPSLILPSQHGETGDQGAPVGSGIAVLMGLGAAYLVAQRRKEK